MGNESFALPRQDAGIPFELTVHRLHDSKLTTRPTGKAFGAQKSPLPITALSEMTYHDLPGSINLSKGVLWFVPTIY